MSGRTLLTRTPAYPWRALGRRLERAANNAIARISSAVLIASCAAIALGWAESVLNNAYAQQEQVAESTESATDGESEQKKRIEELTALTETDRAFGTAIEALTVTVNRPDNQALQLIEAYVRDHPSPPALDSPEIVALLVKQMEENEAEWQRTTIIRILRHTGESASAALPALSGALTSSSFDVRLNAAVTLLALDANNANALGVLVDALKSKDPDLRRQAKWELRDAEETYRDKLIDLILSGFADQSEEVQIDSVTVLRSWVPESPRAVEALRTVFGSTSAAVRASAIDAIAYRHYPRSETSAATVDALIAVLQNDPDDSVRISASRALTDPPQASRAAVARALVNVAQEQGTSSEPRTVVATTLGRLNPTSNVPVLATLVKLLQDDDDTVAVAAAGALGRGSEEDKPLAVSSLIAAVDNEAKADSVRAAAAASLAGHSKDLAPDDAKVLIRAAGAESAELRAAAMLSLGRLPHGLNSRLQPIFTTALSDDDQEVRLAAANAIESHWRLGELEDAVIVEALATVLTDTSNDGKVRAAAARALGKMSAGSPIGSEALAAAIEDVDSAVKLAAVRVIQWLPQEIKGVAAEPLARLLADPEIDQTLRTAVIRSFTEFPDEHRALAIAAIEAVYIDDRSVWIDAAPVLESLGGASRRIIYLTIDALLKNADPDVRLDAVRALSEMPGVVGTARLQLADALDDPDPRVRIEATALFDILPWNVQPTKGVALESLIDGLKDMDPEVRARSALALRNLDEDGRGRAVRALVDALEDSEPAVRKAAAQALVFSEPKSAKGIAIDALVQRLAYEQDKEVVFWAVTALNRAPRATETKTIPTLIVALADTSRKVRTAAAAALGATETQRPAVVSGLRKALSDPDAEVVSAAATAIGKKGSPSWRIPVTNFERSSSYCTTFNRRRPMSTRRAGISNPRVARLPM